MNIDLQSHELWAPPPKEYLLYGAGVSEVSVLHQIVVYVL